MSGKRSNKFHLLPQAPFFSGTALFTPVFARIFRLAIISLSVMILIGGTISSSLAQSDFKSPARAFFYSFLIPGLGQKYVSNIGNARYFIASEAIMIGLAVGHELYSDWLEEDYRAFAGVHAGIDPSGKDKNYFIDISRFNSIFIFNESKRKNREFESVISETPENIWVWDSRENRLIFHDRRVNADKLQNRTIYFYTGIFLNHVISGMHAALKAKKYNGQSGQTGESGENNFDMKFMTTNPLNPTHKVVFSFRF